jgi:hypothetical protein
MIKEKDIVFVTTTLYTKWLFYQSSIIKELFPESTHIWVDGRKNWPNSWFDWIAKLKYRKEKYYVHVDEDFFFTSKKEFMKCIELMENDDISLLGCPDGYHQFRQHNPVAINTFFMIGKIEDLKEVSFEGIKFMFNKEKDDWENSYNILFKNEFIKEFNYNFPQDQNCRFDNYEPYYVFMWLLKEKNKKFGYLYPKYNEEYKVTTPMLEVNSEPIGYHMWYTRQWNSYMDVLGLPNIERYKKMELFLNGKYKFSNFKKRLIYFIKLIISK